MAENSLYKDKYGAWAGFPQGHKPDFERCCMPVWSNDNRWSRESQCSRKRGFGPDKAYCKQHDPDAVAKRRAASNERYNEQHNRERYKWYGRTFFDALQQIADGHNDARGLAQDVIAEFKSGERGSTKDAGDE